MYLFKRCNRYYLSFENAEGKEVRVSTGRKTKVEATEFLRKFKLEEHLKKLSRQQKTLSEFMKEFARHSSCQHSPKTTASYRTALVEFQQTIGDKQLKEYDVRDVEEFILRRRQVRSLFTVRSYHAHLSAAFESARRWGHIEHNPFTFVRRVRPPESTPTFLSKPQFQLPSTSVRFRILRMFWLQQ